MDRETAKGLAFLSFVIAATFFVFGGCLEGGANDNEQSSGNNDRGGIDLGGGTDPNDPGYGAIAIAPDGSYFLSVVGTELVKGDLSTGEVTAITPVDAVPTRVVFAESLNRFYVTSDAGGWIKAVDPTAYSLVWERSLSELEGDVRVYTSDDDQHLILAADTTYAIVDAQTGATRHQLTAPNAILDVDITADNAFALITPQHTWDEETNTPNTPIQKVRLSDGNITPIDVPNCASPLVLNPDSTKAFLAPTLCSRDPISIIDLEQNTFVRNLPGFGPVAIASDGVTAIGFMDAQAAEEELFLPEDPRPDAELSRYYLMVLDTHTLTFEIAPFGDSLPRYALTPNGKEVLTDDGIVYDPDGNSAPTTNIRVLNVAELSLEEVAGPMVRLDHFALSPDSTNAYLLYEANLFELDIAGRAISERSLPFEGGATALNITPSGRRLLLRDEEGNVHLYELATSKLVLTLPRPSVRTLRRP